MPSMNTTHFVIFWDCGRKAYIPRRNPNSKPYVSSATDPDVKCWKTRKAAEKWLSLKDPKWASACTVEEVVS